MKKYLLRALLGCGLACLLVFGVCIPPSGFPMSAMGPLNWDEMPVANALDTVPRRNVRVGFFAFEGYHMQNDEGYHSGYGYEFLQLAARYTNWRYAYIGYHRSWKEMQQMLADGEIDLLTSAQKTPEREQQFAFSDRPIGTSSTILTVRAGDNRFVSGQYEGYNDIRIGLLWGNSRNAALQQFAQEKGFRYTPVYFDTIQELTKALRAGGEIDAAVTSNLRTVQNEWIMEQFAPSPFYAIVRKGDERLLEELNASIEQMDIYSPEWRMELFSKYYSPGRTSNVAFTTEERAYIYGLRRDNIVIRAAMNPDKAPYSYFDKEGKPRGILPEIFAEIAKRAGLAYEILPVKSADEYRALLASGEADIDLDAYFSYAEAERYGFELTKPFVALPMSQVVRRNFAGEPQTVAMSDPTLEQYLKERQLLLQDKKVRMYSSVQECMQAVRNGDCDATYLFTYRAQNLLREDASNDLVMIVLPQMETRRCIAVSMHNDYRLLSVLNKSVDNVLRSAVPQQILLKYLADLPQPEFSLQRYLSQHPLAAVVGVTVCILLVAGWLLAVQRVRSSRLERRHLAEIERQRQALKDALETAHQASEAKGSFLSRMSHEIRTPLNAIIGYITVAQFPQADAEKIQHCLKNSELASKHLLEIINDVLDISAIESGHFKIAQEPFRMKELLEPTLAIFSGQAQSKQITFETELTSLEDTAVIGDQLRVSQILMNLLSNAVKFTPPGGRVSLRVQQTHTSDTKILLKFEIQDTGIGMSEEYLSRIFQPFEQESAGTARQFGGTGLGLSITQNLTHLMHGSIEVRSKLNEGSCFTVSLPFLLAEKQPQEHRSAELPKELLAKLRILLVEDNEMNREIAKAILTEAGLCIDTASDGAEAVQKVEEAPPGTYQCIFMDLQMPVLDGYEATRRIRHLAHPDAQSLPIIAVTADVFSEDVARALACGMNDYISKPIDYPRLVQALLRHVALPQQADL